MYEIFIYCNFELNFDKEFLNKLTILKRFKKPLLFFNVPQQNDSMWRLPKSFHIETHFVSAYSPKHNKEPTLRLRNLVCGPCDQNLSSSFNLLHHIRNIHNRLEIPNVFHVMLYSDAQSCSKVIENNFNYKPPRLLFFNGLCPITTCKPLFFKLRSMILSRFPE